MKILDDHDADGFRRRAFVLERDGHEVHGSLWSPPRGAHGVVPLVLVGHGASGSRNQDYVRAVGRRLARDHGVAAASIDGPVHGKRRSDGVEEGQRAFLEFAAKWSSDESLTDFMVADWQASLDELLELDEVTGPAGYWGLSMGTIFGLPLVAAEHRIEAAVLGLMGIAGPTKDRIAADAPLVRCPVLFLVQWSDELFQRDRAFELFDALGTTDKTLHANPGSHGEVPGTEFDASVRFLAERLRPGAG